MYRILIVDDEKIERKGVSFLIKQMDVECELTETVNGQEALEWLEENEADILLTDVKMPHMDGITMAKTVREQFPDVQFVFLSGYTDKEYLKEAIHLHVDAYIEKPVNLDEFTATIKKLVANCVKRRQTRNLEDEFYKVSPSKKERNERVYTLSQGSLKNLEKILKGTEQAAAVKELKTFCAGIRECEGTPPAYVCNVYFQLSLQLQNAAHYHNAKETLREMEQFSQQIIHAPTLDYLEMESFRLLDALFLEIATRDLDPVALVNSYIEKNFADSSVTIDKIAQDLKFNASYLCERYKQYTNVTISNALTATRIEEACRLLKTTDMMLYEIAYRVGYSNGKYFSKVFQKETGMSPKDYRRLHHG